MTPANAIASLKHGRKAVLCLRGIFLTLCLGYFAPAVAGTFQISPTLAEVPADASTATFRLINPMSTPLTVQVEAVRWRQQGNESSFGKADDLIIVPPLVRIAPGKTQLVRIAHRNRDKSVEMAYRVRFHEVPAPPPPGFVGVQTALKLDVPLFFSPTSSRGELEWHAERNPDGKLELSISNTGTRFARFAEIELQKGGKATGRMQGPLYVLPGNTRELEFPELYVTRGEKYKVVSRMGAARQEVLLVVE